MTCNEVLLHLQKRNKQLINAAPKKTAGDYHDNESESKELHEKASIQHANVNALLDAATSYQRDEYDGHFEGPVEVVLRRQPTTGKYARKR